MVTAWPTEAISLPAPEIVLQAAVERAAAKTARMRSLCMGEVFPPRRGVFVALRKQTGGDQTGSGWLRRRSILPVF